MALTTWTAFQAAHPDKANMVAQELLVVKGVGVNEIYLLEADPATGQLPVSLSSVVDFGTSTTALRTASLIGNATGIADFGSGANSAQTLRVTPATDAPHLLATRHETKTTPLSVRLSNSTDWLDSGSGATATTTLRNVPANDAPHLLATRHEAVSTPLAIRISDSSAFAGINFGLSSASLRTAAMIGNASGGADFGSGVLGAQTLRICPATDATFLLNTRHEAVATPLATRIGNGANFADFGSGAQGAATLRITPATDAPHLLATRHETVTTPIATRIGNGAGFADFGSGAVATTTLRITPASDSPHLLAARHEAAATPLATRIGNGTNFADYGIGQSGAATPRVAIGGRVASNAFSRTDYTSTPVSTAAYTQLVASTSAATTRLQIFDSCGQTMKLATGGAGAEVDCFVIPPGGIDIDYYIPASTRVSIKAVSASANTGEIDINFLT